MPEIADAVRAALGDVEAVLVCALVILGPLAVFALAWRERTASRLGGWNRR